MTRPLDLSEHSAAYGADADAYDEFSLHEDAPGLVLEALAPMAVGKDVLDLGCGSGKYTAALASVARSVVGMDRSADQLDRAYRRCSGLPNVALFRGDAAERPAGRAGFDLAVACWVLGTVSAGDRREEALRGMLEALRPGGRAVLVENAGGCEFEALRGRADDPLLRTAAYNDWICERGFRPAAEIDTYFRFPNLDAARSVFGTIWGSETSGRIASARIAHRAAVYVHDVGSKRGAIP